MAAIWCSWWKIRSTQFKLSGQGGGGKGPPLSLWILCNFCFQPVGHLSRTIQISLFAFWVWISMSKPAKNSLRCLVELSSCTSRSFRTFPGWPHRWMVRSNFSTFDWWICGVCGTIAKQCIVPAFVDYKNHVCAGIRMNSIWNTFDVFGERDLYDLLDQPRDAWAKNCQKGMKDVADELKV